MPSHVILITRNQFLYVHSYIHTDNIIIHSFIRLFQHYYESILNTQVPFTKIDYDHKYHDSKKCGKGANILEITTFIDTNL